MSDILVTGVDFVALQTRDHAAAAKFYGETLGLPFVKSVGHDARVGVPGGQPDARRHAVRRVRTRVRAEQHDGRARGRRRRGRPARSSRPRGSSSAAASWTPASATRRSSPTPTATRLRCTTAMRPGTRSRPPLPTPREWAQIVGLIGSLAQTRRRSRAQQTQVAVLLPSTIVPVIPQKELRNNVSRSPAPRRGRRGVHDHRRGSARRTARARATPPVGQRPRSRQDLANPGAADARPTTSSSSPANSPTRSRRCAPCSTPRC